nr:putative inactive leucine-rich repeat receptor kinase xiao [Quercus suber]
MSSFANNVILLWFIVITFLPCSWGQECSIEQKRALLEIRNSTNGSVFADWDGRDCCNAPGITCDGIDGGVSSIYLQSDNATSSKWYPNVTLFTIFDELQVLSLNSMNIGGELKPFCELKRLKSLSSLDLGNNLMEGTIHPCLGGIEKLEQLVLSGNRFHGNVPPLLLSNQSKIVLLDVSSNQLEGVLSFSIFANVTSLEYIDLSNNYLEVETESPSWVPTFYLTKLNLANCNLNKKNGHVVPSFISTQLSLNWLDLSHSSIEGGIPCQLLFNTGIQGLFLRGNKLTGSFLDCNAKNQTSSIVSFDISDNQVRGPLPENIGHLLPLLEHCNMSSNALEGNIPWTLGNLSLEILDLSNNMLTGTIPQSLTKNGSAHSLVYLNLSNNKLQGKMLPRDSIMPRLECLQLSGNRFEGVISPTISNSPSLVILDVRYNYLSGNIPRWLYNHPSLVAVLLRGNRFEGHLLRRMCQMRSLQVLDISFNHISGGIPSCVNNITFWKKSSPTGSNWFTQKGRLRYLKSLTDLYFEIGTSLLIKNMEYTFNGLPLSLMTGIDMSSNQLTGSIPSEMGELSQLRSLNLSNNFLTGSLPISFRNLKNVESLDLSHNKLSGKIPSELVELTSLSVFSVAYNNLSGRIPFEQQFSTFNMKSYDGNPDLCGGPLPRNCSTPNQPDPTHKRDQKDQKEIMY